MLPSHLRSRPQDLQSERMGKTLLGRLGSELFWKIARTRSCLLHVALVQFSLACSLDYIACDRRNTCSPVCHTGGDTAVPYMLFRHLWHSAGLREQRL